MRIRAVVFLLICMHFSVLAQSDIAFIASTNADKVIPGQPFEVNYEIKNADASSFHAPDFSPLQKLNGPHVSSSIRIVNGRKSSSKTYSFTLSAPSAGTYSLEAASAQVNGNILKSNSLKIEVIPISKESKIKNQEEVFLQLVPSDTSPYVGEQLVLDYVLYYNVPIEDIYKINELDFEGFFVTNINDFPRSVNQTSINGKPYSRQIIKRVGLFGQQSGEYEFGPLFLRVEIPREGRPSPFSIFRNTEQKEIYTESLFIEVQSLPEGAPENFSGGVGRFSIQARAEHQQVTMGEAVEVTVRVEGQSDPNILDPPSLFIEGKAESYNPQLSFENENIHKGLRSFTKTWTYLVVPEEEGKFSVQPYLIHLNTETGTYDSLMADKLELWAKPASDKNNDVVIDHDGHEVNKNNHNYWAWILTALLFIGIIAFLYFRYYKKKPPHQAEKEQIQQTIHFITQQRNNPPPDLAAIKQRINVLKSSTHIDTNTINTWKEKLDYHQYSPVKDMENINTLLQEIVDQLRKA